MYCKNCGREQQNNERFCAQCGTPYESAQQPNAPVIPNIPNIPVSGSVPVPLPISQVSTVAPTVSVDNQAEHRCPNCGANYTNVNNCEYCGSLLVRFVEKGIDLSKTSYLNNDNVIPGLIPELKKNIKMQKATSENIATDIYINEGDKGEVGYTFLKISAIRSGHGYWDNDYDGQEPIMISDSKTGLVILWKFDEELNPQDTCWYDRDPKGTMRIHQKKDEIWKAFKSFPSFCLFTQHTRDWDYKDGINGKRIYMRKHSYAIDFGEDAEGAARLISEILYSESSINKKYNPNNHKQPEYFFSTNTGDENIAEKRERISLPELATDEGDYGEDEEKGGIDWKYWICLVLAALFFLYNFLNR